MRLLTHKEARALVYQTLEQIRGLAIVQPGEVMWLPSLEEDGGGHWLISRWYVEGGTEVSPYMLVAEAFQDCGWDPDRDGCESNDWTIQRLFREKSDLDALEKKGER